VGAFYRPDLGDTAGDVEIIGVDSGCCPLCRAALVAVGGWLQVRDLEREGLRDVEQDRRRIGRERIFGGPRGSP
jgi:hypothetical protein